MAERDMGPALFMLRVAEGAIEVEGIGLRDYFAGQALVACGALMASRDVPMSPEQKIEGLTDVAYAIADLMLARRQR